MKQCPQCHTSFAPNPIRTHQRYCSDSCRREYNSHRFRLPSLGQELEIPASTVGALNELRAAVDLMARGYHVFRALSPSCECDLIATSNGQSLRIEVRTAYRGPNGKLHCRTIKSNKADILAAVMPNEIVYLPELP